MSKDSASSDKFRGLGHLDSRQDILSIEFELKTSLPASSRSSTPNALSAHSERTGNSSHVKKRRSGKSSTVNSMITVPDRTVEVRLAQDTTALRSRTGDTGSVVWRASIDFARFILEQNHNKVPNALLDHDLLQEAHVLELGSGTGLLGVLLSPLVKKYTLTDIKDLIPLIRKNLSLNIPGWDSLSRSRTPNSNSSCNITAEPLDWLELLECPPTFRRNSFSYDSIDLLLIVDCIYHPSLLPALVYTIDYLSTPQRTVVLVVVELRAEDVMRHFLELWLEASGKGTWEIWHVHDVLEGPYAVWIGRKKSGPGSE